MSQFDYEEHDDELNNNDNQRDDEDEDLIEPEAVEMMDDEDESSTSSGSLQSLTNINQNLKFSTTTNNTDTRSFISMGTNNKNKANESVNNNSVLSNLIMIDDESEDRKRFQIELEFVQSLANPYYLNFLAQRGYFANETFLNYLKYLMYWKEPEYCKYLVYPQCLALLDLLQEDHFIKEIVNSSFSKFIDEQLLLIWLNYKKRRDWKRFEPTKLPKNAEKIFKNQGKTDDNTTSQAANETVDYFSANTFIENEKY